MLVPFIKRIKRIPKEEKRLFLEAFRCALYTRLIIIFPLRVYKKWVTRKPSKQKEIICTSSISITIRRLHKYFPFHPTCLLEAIVAKKMLLARNMNSSIIFGVRRIDKTLQAHAWLECEGEVIVGNNNIQSYTVVYVL